ncbi:MAG: hypothetical protein WKG00_07195 [Polyangiaceae bacterium]
MPPWIIPDELPLAPKARSLRSKSATRRPRMLASRATPEPFTPPPMTTTSTSVLSPPVASARGPAVSVVCPDSATRAL